MTTPSDLPATSTSSSPPTTIKTRLLLLSDTHSHPLHPSTSTTHAYRSPLPRADLLLHAGDLSFSGELAEYRRTFELLRDADADVKLVIPGNHDMSLDAPYVRENFRGMEEDERERWIAEARELWTGEEARRAGIVMMGLGPEGEEGRVLRLKNGAEVRIWATPYTPAFCNMAFAYEREHDRFNLPAQSPHDNPDFHPPNPCPSWPDVDIMITHGPPMHHMDDVSTRGSKARPVGCINQLYALERLRPRLGVFGHIHEGWGAERVEWGGRGLGGEQGTLRDLEPEEGGTVTKIEVGSKDPDVLKRGCAYIDASQSGGHGLRWGRESLLVNAAILNRGGRPENAPWIVDLDLPRARSEGTRSEEKAVSQRL